MTVCWGLTGSVLLRVEEDARHEELVRLEGVDRFRGPRGEQEDLLLVSPVRGYGAVLTSPLVGPSSSESSRKQTAIQTS